MKLHRVIISAFCLFAMSCTNLEFQNLQNLKDKCEVVKSEQIIKKKCLDEQWYTLIHTVKLTKSGVIPFLKEYAHQLNLNLMFYNEVVIPDNFNYTAYDRSFIDIVLDIAAKLDLRVTINKLNCFLEQDHEYIHNYSLKDLPGAYKGASSTELQSNFNLDQSRDAKNEYSNKIDYYEEIEKNLQNLFQKDAISRYSINKQAGVLTVVAKQKVHKQISSYLMSLSQNMNDEVLVEANIIEVNLDQGYEMGIDWNQLLPNDFSNFLTDHVFAITSGSEATILKELKAQYKQVKSVSNPRMMISNNHFGIFKAVENYPYFDYRVDTLDNGQNKGVFSSKKVEMKNAVVGVTLYVHVLKLDDNRMKLYFKPTVTEISKEIDHDGYKYLTSNQNTGAANQVEGGDKTSPGICPKIPVLRTREMDSTITLNNGQSIVIGGLILDKVEKNNSGFSALLSKLTLGFFAASYKNYKSELVIILTAKSIDRSIEYDYYEILLDR